MSLGGKNYHRTIVDQNKRQQDSGEMPAHFNKRHQNNRGGEK